VFVARLASGRLLRRLSEIALLCKEISSPATKATQKMKKYQITNRRREKQRSGLLAVVAGFRCRTFTAEKHQNRRIRYGKRSSHLGEIKSYT